jgi:DNA modification methylase
MTYAQEHLLVPPTVRSFPIDHLKPDPKNARVHDPRQVKLLAKSIQSFGFVVPVLIDGSGNVLAGHGRIMAARKLGIREVPTLELSHLTPEQIAAFRIADNRLSELASWNQTVLGEQLKLLADADLTFDIEATGFTIGEIDLHIESLSEMPPGDGTDFIDDIAGPDVAILGDLWQLGEHRLLCGNALVEADYAGLMEKHRAAMVFTDPPYNVRIEGHAGGKGRIRHPDFRMASGEMSSREFTAFLNRAMSCIARHSKPASLHYFCMDWRHMPELLEAAKDVYEELVNLCVWKKHQAGMGSFYRSQHELVVVYQSGRGSHRNNIELGRFGRARSNVWEYPGIQGMRHGEEGDLLALHPTVKPVRMVADAILDCTRRGEVVLDAFAGSGTTLLAAERTGRVCHAMELEAGYVDVAIRRWRKLTGEDAIHVATGETFTERQQRMDPGPGNHGVHHENG